MLRGGGAGGGVGGGTVLPSQTRCSRITKLVGGAHSCILKGKDNTLPSQPSFSKIAGFLISPPAGLQGEGGDSTLPSQPRSLRTARFLIEPIAGL